MKKILLLFAGLAFLTYKNQAQTVTDIDGNIYNTITLGTQTWMKENLKTTRYSNGDSIGTTIPATLDISSESTPRYQWAYNGNVSNVATYGRLFTWYAITDSRNVCPTDWKIPSDTDWTVLTNYLINNGYGYGGSGNDIGKSTASTSLWNTNPIAGNIGNDQLSNNSSGFAAFPGGGRLDNGSFVYMGMMAGWWSSSQNIYNTTKAWGRDVYYDSSTVYRGFVSKKLAFSIRCISDPTTKTEDIGYQENLKMYPNPATDKIVIDLDGKQNQNLYIYNFIGELMLQRELGIGRNEINISSLVAGMYIIKVSCADGTLYQKIIKE
jgi:uncharacterized protein (TIGR02145 family)